MAKSTKKTAGSRAKKTASASKRTRAAAPAPARAPAASGEDLKNSTLLMPNTKTVQDLVRQGKNAKKDASAITGAYGEKIARAVENQHLDRKALAIVKQLDALSEERLHITFFHMLRYMDDLNITARAKSQEEMFSEHQFGEGGEDAGDDDAGEDANAGDQSNVHPIGNAARRVTEAAGGM